MKISGAPRRNLLLVEDDPANSLTLSALLEDMGFAVAIAESCAQAVRLLEAQPRYDLVLLDSMLEDGDGWELIPLVRHHVPEAKLVLVSGQKPSGTGAPVDAVFLKGEPVDTLLSCLERLLGRA